MIWLMKHWKPALATALLLALIAAWQADRTMQYRKGRADEAAKISLTLAEAANKQAAAAREKERRAAAETCPQPLQPPPHLMARQVPKAGSYSENARLNMRDWQKQPTAKPPI